VNVKSRSKAAFTNLFIPEAYGVSFHAGEFELIHRLHDYKVFKTTIFSVYIGCESNSVKTYAYVRSFYVIRQVYIQAAKIHDYRHYLAFPNLGALGLRIAPIS